MAQMLEQLVVDGPRLVLPTSVTFAPRSYQVLKKALIKANGKGLVAQIGELSVISVI
ncbi:hypothetical protein [Aeromonas hydrophila]|uniref:hypothetical protein n=1 Tax=Aeromonas hydrophila TaxID=644 RepID=UPI0023B05744|nr:hypothetical protein [Aeromonas hydrophila]